MNLSNDEQRRQEIFYFKQRYFSTPAISSRVSATIKMEEVLQRKTEQICEKKYEFPQNIFFIRLGLITIVGRKLISRLSLNERIKELHFGSIKNYMLFGVLESFYKSPDEVKVEYHPLLNIEKVILFDKVKERNNIELIYPFHHAEASMLKRRVHPRDGWPVEPTYFDSLSVGEERIQQYTIHYLKQFDLDNKVIYDLNCSTGRFLSAIKGSFPECHTLGQDVSQKILDRAKNNVDEVLLGHPMKPTAKDRSIDFCFVRILNAGTVTRNQAKAFLFGLTKCLKKNGRIIIFGQDPVLLTKKDFEQMGFEIECCKAYDRFEDAIFQYYVLKNDFVASDKEIS